MDAMIVMIVMIVIVMVVFTLVIVVFVLVGVTMIGRLDRPERQASMAMRAVVVMFVRPEAVPVGKGAVHELQRTARGRLRPFSRRPGRFQEIEEIVKDFCLRVEPHRAVGTAVTLVVGRGGFPIGNFRA